MPPVAESRIWYLLPNKNLKVKFDTYFRTKIFTDWSIEKMSKKQAILITGCDSGFGYSLTCHLASKHPEFLTIACCYSMNSEGKSKIGYGHLQTVGKKNQTCPKMCCKKYQF